MKKAQDGKNTGTGAPGWLNSDSTHLGIVFGDHDVNFTVSHVALPRSLLALDCHAAALPRQPGCTPSLTDFRKAVRECWREICEPRSGRFVLRSDPDRWIRHRSATGMGHVLNAARDYWQHRRMPPNDCFVCLPAWCTGCTDAFTRTRIPRRMDATRSRVTVRHLERAVQALCREHTPPGRTAIAVFPEYFSLDGDRKLANPVDHDAEQVEIRAHIFHAEEGMTLSLMDLLYGLNLQVRMLATPLMLGRELIRPADFAGDGGMVTVGPRHSGLSFHQGETLVRAVQVEAGTDEMTAAMAARLRVEERDLVDCLASKRDWLSMPDAYGQQRLKLKPASGGNGLTVREVVDAAVDAAGAVFRPIQSAVERVEKDRGFRCRWLAMAGDDPVLTGALAAAGRAMGPVPCRPLAPPGRGPHTEMSLPEWALTSGLLRMGALNPPAYQPYLGICRPPPVEAPVRTPDAPELTPWAGILRAWRMTAPHVQAACRMAYRRVVGASAAASAARDAAAAAASCRAAEGCSVGAGRAEPDGPLG